MHTHARTAIIQPRHAALGFLFGKPRDDPLGRPSRPTAGMALRDDPSRLARGGEIPEESVRAPQARTAAALACWRRALGTGGQPAHARSREAYGRSGMQRGWPWGGEA